MIFPDFSRVENIVGKEDDASYQHFLLFPKYFQKASFPVALKTSLCGKGLIKQLLFLEKTYLNPLSNNKF